MDDAYVQLEQPAARQLLLAQAIDEADTQGKLLSSLERERIEQDALDASRDVSGSSRLDRKRYLHERALRVLAAVQTRNPKLAALADGETWRGLLAWGLPLAACALGAAIDRIDNPQQVNMLSPPLLAVLLWNLLVYVALLVAVFLPRAWLERGPLATLQRQAAGWGAEPRRSGNLRADVAMRFRRLWLGATARWQAHWWRAVLHLTAAGWAVGLAISIVLGGLVREYRVGWESTLLDLPQVHAFLSALFAPVVALLPMEAFSAAELQRMHFRSGAAIGVDEARRWVWLYLALLALVVVLPRLVLAAFAAWRARMVGRTVRIDVGQPYYADLLARVSPVRVALCLLSRHVHHREVLLHALRHAADQPALRASAPPLIWTVLATTREDELRLLELPDLAEPPTAADGPAPGWWARIRGPAPAPRQDLVHTGKSEGDVVLLLPASANDVKDFAPLLRWLDKPVLLLADEDLEACRDAAAQAALRAEVLPLQDYARSWLQHKALRDVIAQKLPPAKLAGFGRIAAAWGDRNQARFCDAMRLIAGQLLQAAREVEEVRGDPLSLKRLVQPREREAGQQARQAAMDAILRRVREAEAQTLSQLLRLHGIEEPVGAIAHRQLQDRFVVQQAVDSPQASMAGAASGAAVGAGIDLMTGGLTLGAAAALGALVGGAAAYTAAHWKNRAAPGGAALVQPGDEMLQALAEQALLRYLAVIHWGPGPDADIIAPRAFWQTEVIAAFEAEQAHFTKVWAAARSGQEAEGLLGQTGRLLETVAKRVFVQL